MMKYYKFLFQLLFCIGILIEVNAQETRKKSNLWNQLQQTANSIGFCVYHINQPKCDASKKIQEKLNKHTIESYENEYFPLNYEWAEKRIKQWAEKQQTKATSFILLYDINQGTSKLINDSISSHTKKPHFYILNIKKKRQIKFQKYASESAAIQINSIGEPDILSNTLWREFISDRLGAIESKVRIQCVGMNAEHDTNAFYIALSEFLQKENEL